MNDKLTYTIGSDNIFADLGVTEPQESLIKAKLAYRISTLIDEQGLTQKRAAEILGVDQPKVSALVRGRLTNFSAERLMTFVAALGEDVDIVTHPKAATEERAAVRVHHGAAALEALQCAAPRL